MMDSREIVPREKVPMDFSSFYAEFYTNIVYYLVKKIGNLQDAEDLAANVFLYCYEHFSSYDPEKASPGTWLYIIVNSRLKNWYRDRHAFQNLDELYQTLPDDAPLLEEAMILQEQRDFLAKALDILSDLERQLVFYRYFKHYSGDEIAKKTGVRPEIARVKLSRAIDKMERYCKMHYGN